MSDDVIVIETVREAPTEVTVFEEITAVVESAAQQGPPGVGIPAFRSPGQMLITGSDGTPVWSDRPVIAPGDDPHDLPSLDLLFFNALI